MAGKGDAHDQPAPSFGCYWDDHVLGVYHGRHVYGAVALWSLGEASRSEGEHEQGGSEHDHDVGR